MIILIQDGPDLSEYFMTWDMVDGGYRTSFPYSSPHSG